MSKHISPDFFLTIEQQQAYSTTLYVHVAFSLCLSAITFYFLLWQTPPNQQAIRTHLLMIVLLMAAFDIVTDMLTQPCILLPLPAGYFIGLLNFLPVNIIVAVLFMTALGIGEATILCFLHKHQTLIDDSSRFKIRPFIYKLYLISCVVAPIVVLVVGILGDVSNATSDRAMEMYPFKLDWLKERGPYYVKERNVSNRILSCVILLVFSFVGLFVLALVWHMLYVLNTLKGSRSVTTRKMIRASVIALSVQLVVPAIFQFTPFAIGFIWMATETGSHQTFRYLYHLFLLYSPLHSIILLAITPAYRRAILSFISRFTLIQKVISTAQAARERLSEPTSQAIRIHPTNLPQNMTPVIPIAQNL